MQKPVKRGIYFGITSAIITTLGMITGLNAGSASKLIIIGGIFSIAIADAFSDSLGMHISEEAEKSNKSAWYAMVSTFLAKLIFALTFVIPFLLLNLNTAFIISIIWGFLSLAVLSWILAEKQKTNHIKVIAEHLIIAVVVIIATHIVGRLVYLVFS